MKSKTFILIAIVVLFGFGCEPDADDRITEKIIYDVQIKNTDANSDWWKNNLPGPARDKLVKSLMDGAKSGDVIVRDENGTAINSEEAANIGIEIASMTFQHPEPPYNSFDTIARSEIDYRDITRIRFMEEWYFDDRHFLINKKIIAIAPVVENYGPDGKFRGYEALFWVFEE
jgi:predicted metal-binding protein